MQYFIFYKYKLKNYSHKRVYFTYYNKQYLETLKHERESNIRKNSYQQKDKFGDKENIR